VKDETAALILELIKLSTSLIAVVIIELNPDVNWV